MGDDAASRRHLAAAPNASEGVDGAPVPLATVAVHLLLLAGVVMLAHHPVAFLALFLLFLGFTQAYERHQDPLILREALLVGFFLAGLVVLGGLQQWWLQPIVSSLEPLALFFGALGLTAVTDNAALTYLGSLITGIRRVEVHARRRRGRRRRPDGDRERAQSGRASRCCKHGFADESIGAGGLLLGALGPTAVAAAAFLVL